MLTRWSCFSAIFSCSVVLHHAAVAHDGFPEKVTAALETAFREMSSQDHVVNSVAMVDAKGGQMSWHTAAGFADPQTNEKMTVRHLFRTASVTKSFTGVLVLQLIEAGKLKLDTPIHTILSPKHFPQNASVDDIHILDNKPHGNSITVQQLLCHTSGLADYWFDKGSKAQWSGRSWLDVMEAEAFNELAETFDPPTRLWTPDEIVQFFFEIGLNHRAHFKPGEGFLYSDTNYLLLGMIVEEITGEKLAACYRDRIYKPLKLKDIYKEHREHSPTKSRLAHHFWWLREKNLDVATEQIASTAEWANGGQITSADDLRTFIRGVFTQKLFNSPDTLNLMKNASSVDLSEPQKYFDNGASTYNRYSCGFAKWKVNGVEVWGHTGFWGVGMFYVPKEDVTITFATNQVATNAERDMERFVKALQQTGVLTMR